MKSTTAKFYSKNPASREKKQKYDAEFQKKPAQVKKRVEANRANREANSPKGDKRDYDHAVKKFVPESVNRGRKEKSRLKGSKRS